MISQGVRIGLGLFFVFIFNVARSQPSPSSPSQPLTLRSLFDAASVSYPSLLAARLEARASLEDVSAIERIRWPTISSTLESYTGNLRSYPTRALQVDQTLWDFGGHTAKISEAKVLSDISLLKVYLTQQDVFVQMTSAWQNLVSANERLKVAELTVDRLQSYQAQMRRRVEAEASPRIDLELADARLLQTEVELATAKTSLQVALTRLEQFSGEHHLANRMRDVQYPSTLAEARVFSQSMVQIDWGKIAREHPVAAKARLEVIQTRRRLDAKEAEALPQVFVRVYKPTGTSPTSSDTSTTTFAGVRYSPGAGFMTYAEAKAIATRIDSLEQSVDTAVREMQQTLQNDQEEFANAVSRIAALEKSVNSSALVMASYQRQFQAGRKQWQDLLNQVRELAQNQYALADAKASMVGSMVRLQIRMGEDPK